MKFFRLDLLTLLISLFLFNACKNNDTVGLPVDASKQINGTLIDTATVLTTTVPEDSVVTSGLTNTPLAYFKDPVMGTTEADIATGINPPLSYSPPTGTVTIDSVLLVLRYANNFYGDSLTSKYKINVYQLNNKPLLGATYYNTDTWSYNSNYLIGSKTFNARPNTSFKVYDIVTGKPDTLVKVPPQVRVNLDPAFIQNTLFSLDSTTVASTNLFQNKIKGLFITLDKNQVGNGGRMYMQVDSSFVDVYYHNNTGTAIDTAVLTMNLANHAAQIKHTYSTQVAATINSPTSQETVYLDGLAGLRTKVSFPYLQKLYANNGSNIVLNRAELVITPAPGTDIPYAPQPKITLYRYDIALQRAEVPDANGGGTTAADPRFIAASTFGGYYDPIGKAYHFVITGYISDLMLGKLVDYGTFIAPDENVSATTIATAATTQASGRTVAVGGVTNKNSANYPYRMKLNIIYTKITK